MEVIRATRAGFCMGVSLALKKLENALRQTAPGRIRTLGPIIHNPQVLADFAARGVGCLNEPGMAREGDYVLIRAHGVSRAEEALLKTRKAIVEDATCPKVKSAQLAIADATANGAPLLLFGEASHPEVRGLVSYARGAATVFGCIEELRALEARKDEPLVLASQTTQDREAFEQIATHLKKIFPRLAILSTICDATRLRQEEALRIASQVDVMVVVGGKESGNTRRLANLARQAGIETSHVEDSGELDARLFKTKTRAGLTAGASTPKSVIDAVEKWLHAI